MPTCKMDSLVKPKKRKLMQNSGEDFSGSGPLIMAVPEASVSHDQDLFNKVFTNDLVWKILGSYLNLDDLKDCRLTSQLFNMKIVDLKSFKDRARLNIPLSKFPASDLEKTRVQWRHLAINVDLDDGKDTSTENWWNSSQDSVSNMSQLLSSITSLKLYRTNYSDFGISPEVPATFSKILPMMSNVQKISIDVNIFEKISLSWFERASASLMSKVKEFHLECNKGSENVPDEVMRYSMSLPLESVHLEVLRIDSLIWNLQTPESVIDRLDPLFRILAQNQNSLRSFQVGDPLLLTSIVADELGTLPKFPQLKVLKLQIVTEVIREAHLIQFLNNQPESLEEIDLAFVGPIPSGVFQILKDRAISLNLKVLRIKILGPPQTTPSDMKNWKYLQETNLQEFSFKLNPYPVQLSNEQLQDFFGALPKSAKTLSVTGVMAAAGQPIFNLELSKCFAPQVLTHLSLRRCPGLLKDSVLQEIWKTLKNLQTLDLFDCGNDFTDWGFTGVPAGLGAQGVSMSLLKGLKSLTLLRCDHLTDRTLMDGVKFQELQFLDLQDNSQFTTSGFLAVIRQNPSLQTFLSEHDHESHPDLPTHIDHERQIISVKINSRLTRELRLDYDCNRCISDCEDDFDDSDSDSDSYDDSESDDDSNSD